MYVPTCVYHLQSMYVCVFVRHNIVRYRCFFMQLLRYDVILIYIGLPEPQDTY